MSKSHTLLTAVLVLTCVACDIFLDPVGEAGAPCATKNSWCNTGLVCLEGICMEPGELGDPCSSTSCASTLVCIEGRCEEPRPVGAECASSHECEFPGFCPNAQESDSVCTAIAEEDIAVGSSVWSRCSIGRTWNGTGCAGTASQFDAFYSRERAQIAGACSGDYQLPSMEDFGALLTGCDRQPVSSSTECDFCGDSPECAKVFGQVESCFYTRAINDYTERNISVDFDTLFDRVSEFERGSDCRVRCIRRDTSQ